MLEEYLETLAGLQKLTPEEERALWTLYKDEDDEDARQRLIETYQPLVVREAVKFDVQETVTLDLIQEGTVGLMEAAENYRPELGVAFSLYAVHRVRGRMLDFLGKNGAELPSEAASLGNAETFPHLVGPDLAFESADRSFLTEEIGRAMQRLPAKEQDVIRKMFLEEATAAEAADSLSVSTAYVYRLEKRGIRRLRGMLSRVMHDRKE